MTIFLGILLTLLVFTAIVFIHEMGHFITARMTGMKVEEFGIGIPPKARILGHDKKGTEYTLNWLPIGGFVRIKGEDPGSKEARAKDSFSSKKWWARSLVLIAGVTMNFLLATVIFFGFFLSGASPLGPNTILDTDYGSYLLPSFEESLKTGYITYSGISLTPLSGSVAERAGILPDDMIESLDGEKIMDIEVFRTKISEGKTRTLIVSGTGVSRTIILTPEGGKIGTYLGYKNLSLNREYSERFGFSTSLGKSFHETYALSRMTLDVLGSTLRKLVSPETPTERKEAQEMLSGPIGIGGTFVDVVSLGVTWKILFAIVALLSINLGVLNILPFPALDGGRLLSTSIMSFAGLFTQKNALLIRLEGYIHAFGMVFLLGISLIIALMDISRFF